MPESRSWYEIKDAVAATADLYIYDAIGAYGVSAGSFVDALGGVKAKAINLYVNSPGGDVADGTAIFNALKRHSARVNAVVDGWAASAASFIVQAADRISMGAGSVMVIHDARGVAAGDPATMTEMADNLNLLSDNIAQIYADRAGGTAEEWRALMRAETWYTAQEAVDAKLADELVTSSKASNWLPERAFNLSGFRKVPEWVASAVKLTPKESDPATIEAPKTVPDPVLAVHRMKIPAAMKRAAIAHLKAQKGITIAA